MADKLSRQPQEPPSLNRGTWIRPAPCAFCVLGEAPKVLNYTSDETAVYFSRRPETPEDVAAAERAMDVCPTLAIGNDG